MRNALTLKDIGLALITAAIIGLATGPADAQGAPRGSVTAYSIHGHGEISGPVRRGPQGRPEVMMPGGTWIECGRSCAEALRRETVDFWESRGDRNSYDGAGYFRWRW
jgi:hypothetical protein